MRFERAVLWGFFLKGKILLAVVVLCFQESG